jgi:hypothetical protein
VATEESAIWREWLSLYLDHCRRKLSPRELADLAAALRRGALDSATLGRAVGEQAAREVRGLGDFLGSVADARRRQALVADAVVQLRRAAPTPH